MARWVGIVAHRAELAAEIARNAAKRIAAIHGGDLTADSELGKGARFTLVLPTLDEA